MFGECQPKQPFVKLLTHFSYQSSVNGVVNFEAMPYIYLGLSVACILVMGLSLCPPMADHFVRIDPGLGLNICIKCRGKTLLVLGPGSIF